MIKTEDALDREIQRRIKWIRAAREGKLSTVATLDQSVAWEAVPEQVFRELWSALREEDLVAYNPSLLKHEEKTLIVFRVTDRQNDRKLHNINGESIYATSQVWIAEFDVEELKVTDFYRVNPNLDSIPETHKEAHLFEDLRFLELEDGIYLIGAWNHPTGEPYSCFQMVAKLDLDTRTYTFIEALPKPHRSAPEKNWSPAPLRQAAILDTVKLQYSPTQHFFKNEVIGEPYGGNIHGRSPLLPFRKALPDGKRGGYFGIVGHITTGMLLFPPNGEKITPFNMQMKRNYVSHFARFDSKHRLTHISQPWKLSNENWCEFISGLEWIDEKEGTLLASVGLNDQSFQLMAFHLEEALATLEPYTPATEGNFYLDKQFYA